MITSGLFRRGENRKTELRDDSSWVTRAAGLAGLWGLAVAQPIFDVLGREITFFVAHRAGYTGAVVLAVCVGLVAPLMLSLLAEAVRAVWAAAGRIVEYVMKGMLIFLLVNGLLLHASPQAWVQISIAAVVTFVAVFFLARRRRTAIVDSCLGAVAIAVVMVFLLASPVRKLSAGEHEELTSEPRHGIAILLIFDEFPLVSLLDVDERIDAVRFPNFARLADTATWYRNATTVSQSTVYSIPSILTGRYPRGEGIQQPVVVDYTPNLFTEIGKGARFNVLETASWLCPSELCEGRELGSMPLLTVMWDLISDISAVYLHLVTPRAWQERLPDIDYMWRDFWAGLAPSSVEDDTAERHRRRKHPQKLFDEFVAAIPEHPEPSMHFAHLMMPHLPWNRNREGQIYPTWEHTPHGLTNQFWGGSEWQVTQAQQRHIVFVSYVDGLLGKLRSHLESLGIWDETLLVITSDHGAAFGVKGMRRNLNRDNLVEIVNIPLFVKYPGQQRGVVDDRGVDTIDIAPTIAGTMGVELGEHYDGRVLDSDDPVDRSVKMTYLSGKKGGGSGSPFEYQTQQLIELRPVVLQRNASRFGNGAWDRLYAAGRFGALVGQSLEVLAPSLLPGSATPRVVLESECGLDPVRLKAKRLPVHLLGTVEGGDTHDMTLAVVVNGTVRAVTETYAYGDQVRFTALYPKKALRRGSNELKVFAVSGEPGAAELCELELELRD